MMNAFNTCGTYEVSSIFWSTSLSNRLDTFPIGAISVETPLNPCFSLAHTSLFAPSESLLALLLPLEGYAFSKEMDDIVTDNTHFSIALCGEDAQPIADIARLLQQL